MYILKRDGKEVFQAETYNECLVYLQRHSPFSWNYCFTYDGYTIDKYNWEAFSNEMCDG